MKHIHYYIMSALAALALTGCSEELSEAERLVYDPIVIPADSTNARMGVLIEDFTGQRCVNCPNASEEIESLTATFGADYVIGVGIHSGPFGFAGNERILGFMTDTGNEYYSYWGIQSQPMGVVNRRPEQQNGGSLYTSWASIVRSELQKKASVALSVDNAYDEVTRQLTVSTTAIGCTGMGNTTGKLQLWLTEDSIVALQSMPDGSYNYNYMHQHVFRDAVNGTWGEDIAVAEGDTTLTTHTYTLKEGWEAKNVSVVAFVYNSDGVQQVVRKRIAE